MQRFMTLLVIGAAFVLSTAARPAQDDDIVWPTYVLVSKSYDARLTCSQLNSEIDKVERDIRALVKARLMAEQALRQANDTQTSMGREQGGFLNTGTNKASLGYMEARDQIKESRRIAELRRDHLQSLRPSCKETMR